MNNLNATIEMTEKRGPKPARARWFLMLLAVLASAFTLASPQPASAAAYSCTGYGIGWRYGRPSQFCADTRGSGTWVSTAGAGYSSPIAWAGWLTNTRVKLEMLDTAGNVYKTRMSSQQNGGSAVGGWKWTINSHVRKGSFRYTLLSNGVAIATVSHSIK